MTQPLAAIVLTQSCFETDPETVARKVTERFGEFGVTAKALESAAPDTSRYLVEVDGLELMVIYTGKPIPEETVTGLGRSLFEDERPPTAHRDQAIVTPLHPVEGHAPSLLAALSILRVAYVLAATDAATAVYWMPNGVLMSADYFTRAMDIVVEPEILPIPILSSFVPFPDGEGSEGRHGLAVLGLHSFIGRDLEFAPSDLPVPTVVKSAWDASHWLLHEGAVFKDGDTCGGSASEVIHIRHAERGRISPHPIYELTIERLDPSDRVKQAAWNN